METMMTSCGECLSAQDWYRDPKPTVSRRIRAYEIRQSVRQRHIKRSYADRVLIERRHKFYELACAAAAVVADDTDLKVRFQEQADRWERDTAHLSSPLQRMIHPSYQAILGMAADHKREVISFMLRDLQTNRRDWFLALSYLTQANPINAKDAGKIDKLVNSWIKWGKE